MSLATIVDLVTAAALVFGVVFGAIQLRHLRQQRRVQTALELVHSFQTPEFVRGYLLIRDLPDGLTMGEVESRLGEDRQHVYLVMTTFESLGILVQRRELPLRLVEDFFSGPIIVAWRKLRPYIEEERRATGRETVSEWFQWLAERVVAHESAAPPVPAHVEHAGWKP